MITIALCDDDPIAQDGLVALLRQYQAQRSLDMAVTTFHNPLDLLNSMEQGRRFDVLLLDILMPGQNGIETAEEIRRFDSDVKIIFLTSSSEFAVQSYTVNAFYYLLKPLRRESLWPLLDAVSEACRRERDNSLLLHCRDGITRVGPKQIEFCEVLHRTLLLHLTSGRVLETVGTLDELGRQLDDFGGFLRVHRSFIVNLNYVQNISYRAVTTTSQAEIPIPRGKYNEIKDAFLAYAFQNRQVSR